MTQELHILRKDLRRFWPEWAISLALMVSFARYEIRSWSTGEGAIALGSWFGSAEILSGLVVVLLPIAWMLLIARVVQEESLAGDRQFWVTRPYEWKKLLAAKLFLVLISINVPLLVLDVFLLHKAGFAVSPYFGGLLWMQLLITVFLFVPVAAVATVTASVAQIGLAILLVLLYLIAMSYVASQVPSSSFSFWTDDVQGALYLVTCAIVILLQYARRRTAASRAAILALGAVILLFVVFTPYRKLVASAYPQLGPGEQPPLQLALLPPPDKGQRYGREDEEEVAIQLPLSVSGIQQNSLLVVNGEMTEVANDRGTRWHSGWEPRGTVIFPGQQRTQVYFRIKRRAFEQMRASAVTVRIALAFTTYRDSSGRELVIPAGEFKLPEVGLCSARPPMFERRIHCLAPLRRPSSLLISADISQTTCQPRGEEIRPSQAENAYGWIYSSVDGPAEFGLSPIKTVDLTVSYANFPSVGPVPVVGICPGTPIRLSTPVPVRRARMEMVFREVRLADYQLGGMRN